MKNHSFNIIELSKIDSTNSFAKLFVKSKENIDNTVIFTTHQTAGRGQHNNVWLSPANVNLTFSIVINTDLWKGDNFFFLINCIAYSCVEYLQLKVKTHSEKIKIKWVNDILFDTKKIGGILIENIFGASKFKYSVIGIGLNINQTFFDDSIINKAISLSLITNKKFELKEELHLLLHIIYKNLLKIKKQQSYFFPLYNKYLFSINQEVYLQVENKKIKVIVLGVNEAGDLIVQTKEKQNKSYNFDQVKWLYLNS